MSHTVQADPKAIAARQQERGLMANVAVARDPKEVARKRKAQEQAAQWRKAHGLTK